MTSIIFPNTGTPDINAYGGEIYESIEPYPDIDNHIENPTFVISDKVDFKINVIGEDNYIEYPKIRLQFNGNLIDTKSDLDTEVSGEEEVTVKVEYGKMIELYVEDRLIEQYEVEWLDSNVLVYATNG